MKALVTGATGLIGGNLVRQLLGAGFEVRVLVRRGSDLSTLLGLDVERWYGDVLDAESLTGVAEGCRYVFHAAAVFAYWGHSRAQLEEIAVSGTRNVLAAARAAEVPRTVVTSSSVVLGSSKAPEVRDEGSDFNELHASDYTLSKVRQDAATLEIANHFDLDVVVVCPTLTVGRFDYRLSPSNANLVNYLNDPFRSTFLGGCNIVGVQDVAAGHLIAAQQGSPGSRYVLGSENLRWREVHELTSRLAGTFGPSLTLNNTAAYLAAAALETSARLLDARPTVTRHEAAMAGRFYWYSSDAIRRLGYSPAASVDALAQALAWLIHRALLNESVLDSLRPDPRVLAEHGMLTGRAA